MFHLEIKSKHEPKQNIFLDPLGEHMKFIMKEEGLIEGSPSWCKGLEMFKNDKLLIVWSQIQLVMFSVTHQLLTGKGNGKNRMEKKLTFIPKYNYNELTNADDFTTTIFLNRQLLNFVIGTHTGRLLVWKLSSVPAGDKKELA